MNGWYWGGWFPQKGEAEFNPTHWVFPTLSTGVFLTIYIIDDSIYISDEYKERSFSGSNEHKLTYRRAKRLCESFKQALGNTKAGWDISFDTKTGRTTTTEHGLSDFSQPRGSGIIRLEINKTRLVLDVKTTCDVLQTLEWLTDLIFVEAIMES